MTTQTTTDYRRGLRDAAKVCDLLADEQPTLDDSAAYEHAARAIREKLRKIKP